MLTAAVTAGQASRTTLLAEGAAAVAGDVAETGASFKNEIEAAIAIRCCIQPLHLVTLTRTDNVDTSSNKVWAPRYDTWRLIQLTPKGVVFSFLSYKDDIDDRMIERCSLREDK